MIVELTNLKNNAYYSQQQTLPDGAGIYDITLRYLQGIDAWHMDLTYLDADGNEVITINNQRVVITDDLFSFIKSKNKLPYKVMVLSTNSAEPFGINCWTNGYFAMYLVKKDD